MNNRPPDKPKLRPGDWIEVRSPDEILQTLEKDGTLNGLPFMPEMIEWCGRRARVFQRVIQAVVDGASLSHYSESFVRAFKNDDVVLLEGARCSGAAHGGCQRACMIFWKEAWLRKVEDSESSQPAKLEGEAQLRARLKTTAGPDAYFCQSSEFVKATRHLTALRRLWNRVTNVRVGNCGPLEMVRRLAVWTWWKARQKLSGPFPRGTLQKTPAEALDLQPGEWVEVKPLHEIVATLDEKGKNRGLHFFPDMSRHCGRRYRVRSRADHFIAEGTGQMRHFRHTVLLEGALSDSATYAFGGCPRSDLLCWREIWLRRVQPSPAANANPRDAADVAVTATRPVPGPPIRHPSAASVSHKDV